MAKLTNAEFAVRIEQTIVFNRACALAGIPPTPRQASKWRNGRGIARLYKNRAVKELSDESKVSDSAAT